MNATETPPFGMNAVEEFHNFMRSQGHDSIHAFSLSASMAGYYAAISPDPAVAFTAAIVALSRSYQDTLGIVGGA